MAQLEKHLQPSHGGLAIGGSELLLQGRHFEQTADGFYKVAAPKLVRMAGGHADHRQERRNERTASGRGYVAES
jgi:hypothetical protein